MLLQGLGDNLINFPNEYGHTLASVNLFFSEMTVAEIATDPVIHVSEKEERSQSLLKEASQGPDFQIHKSVNSPMGFHLKISCLKGYGWYDLKRALNYHST